jgi:hypothetical protein
MAEVGVAQSSRRMSRVRIEMSEHEEPDLNEPARPLYAHTEGGERIEIPVTKRDVLADLTTGHGEEIPAAVLEACGITQAEYAAWRMELEDEKRHERDTLAQARAIDDQQAKLREQGMEPMPPRRTPEEVAAIEQREAEIARQKEIAERGEAQWEDEGGG